MANLELKLGHTTVGRENLQNLTTPLWFVPLNSPICRCGVTKPFVGDNGFVHKGGFPGHSGAFEDLSQLPANLSAGGRQQAKSVVGSLIRLVATSTTS